jgi:hypothetical protein
LDLLGFLPSISAVQTFTEDQDPLAYERLVGELLASPHFGERWGRYWLDLARYGDSDGYLDDRLRPNAWIYRDWVINAINRDLPFDQFTIEQLAGDLLPNAKLEQRIATGFHRNTLHNTEAGVDREEYRVKEVVDRVSTTGVVWLGLTLGCAECHSHKYDPITQLEFFNLYAIFNNAQETDLPASLAREQVAHALALQQWQQEHSRLSAELELLAETFDQRQSTWQAELRAQYASTPSHTEVAWQPLTELHLLASSADSSSQLAIDGQGFIEVTGTEADVDTYRLQFALPSGVTRVAALRLELLPGTATDEPLPEPIGRNSAGRFVLSELRVGTQIRQDSNEKIVTIDGNASDSNVSSSPQIIWREWDTALATIQPSGYEVTQAIDGNKTTGWSSLDRVMGRQTALFNFEQPIDIDPTDASTQLVIELEHAIKQAGSLRRFRLSLHPQLQSTADALPQDVVRLLKLPEEQLTESERVKLSAFFVASDSVQIAKQEALFKHVLRTPRLPSTKAAVFSELSTPRVTHVHVRGDYKRPGPLAAPQLIHSLFSGDSSGKQADRLDLAQWLVDPNNPLTARVTVNTWWSRLFGRGIVATPDDFGARGSPPSHAELLDWLALELVRSGWSRKHLIRQIVTSSTYRQSSRNNDLLQSIDPMNILLGRQNRLRLEAEIIRDITLQAGGLLHSEIGGPSILPPLPAYITGISRNREWPLSPLAERHKRGMYILLRRATPYPMLTTFDAPDSSLTCAVRERSNTPLQSLTLLNDGVFFSCAQGLGARLATECDEMDASLHLACQVCLGRAATPDELQRLRRLVVEFQELLSDDPTAASQIVGSSQPTTVFSLRDQAALVLLSRVMLNLDSFFCRE